MQSAKERLSERALSLANSSKSVRLYATAQVAKRVSVRSMTLMRWIVNKDTSCPALHVCSDTGLHWLWKKEEIRRVAEFKKSAVNAKNRRGETCPAVGVHRGFDWARSKATRHVVPLAHRVWGDLRPIASP